VSSVGAAKEEKMELHDFNAAVAELDRLSQSTEPTSQTGWSIPKTLLHVAQSIDASREGFPTMKPALLRKTVGRVVLWRFMSKGAMSHDKEGPIPGAPPLADDGDLAEAVATLKRSIEAFAAHEGPLAPHFVFDELSKADYERIHCMHLADHLSAMRY
jgi:hypothetical protein